MKILISSSTLDIKNGYGNITYELVKELCRNNHSVTLLLPVDDNFYQYDLPGVNIERVLPPYIFKITSRHIFKYLFWNYKPKTSFDVVHSLFEFPYAPLMCRLAQKLKVPFIIGAQGTYGVQPLAYFFERPMMLYSYAHADAIHVPSVYTRDAICKQAKRKYKIDIIHNGVNLKRFMDFTPKGIPLLDEYLGRKILLTVGPLKYRKGQELVIRALPQIVKVHPDVLYVMVGTPTDSEVMKSLANELNVLDNILIVGQVTDDEIVEYFHACDVYVHTPRIAGKFQFEGFGIVYLEAAACGKPSVGSDAGGITDALLHMQTGLVAPPEDSEVIAQHIISLLNDEHLRVIYGSNGKEYALEHSWDKITSQYIELYKRVVKDKK